MVWIPKGSPYERDYYLGGPRFESQPTGPQTTNLALVAPMVKDAISSFTAPPPEKSCKVGLFTSKSFQFIATEFLMRKLTPPRYSICQAGTMPLLLLWHDEILASNVKGMPTFADPPDHLSTQDYSDLSGFFYDDFKCHMH